jgi:uncharacterized protein (DUF1330 family)
MPVGKEQVMADTYVIGSYDIIDPAGYEGYVPGVLERLVAHGAEVIVADFAAEALEGERRGVYCVLKFSSEESARRWYDDPIYEPIKQKRIGSSANSSMILTKGFVQTEA